MAALYADAHVGGPVMSSVNRLIPPMMAESTIIHVHVFRGFPVFSDELVRPDIFSIFTHILYREVHPTQILDVAAHNLVHIDWRG